MKNNKTEPIPVMDYRQYRRARRLVHECCNYIDGNCIASAPLHILCQMQVRIFLNQTIQSAQQVHLLEYLNQCALDYSLLHRGFG